MTKINFYRINGGREDALKLACQLGEKATQQGMSVLFHTDRNTAEAFSQLLWSFRSSAFIPHSLGSDSGDAIAISSEDEPGEHHGLLISLKPETPKWFSRFEKAIEIVYDDQQVITSKREAYRHYKSRGYPLQYHDLSKQPVH